VSELLTALHGVLNAREPVPGLVTGGQPAAAHLVALKRAGCDTVIDTRDPMEPQPIDAPAVVRDAGLAYLNIPVPHTPADDRLIGEVRGTLERLHSARRPTFVYCNSGNRVAAVLIPYFILDLGWSEDEAVARAMEMGLRSTELMEAALDYVTRHKGKAL